VHTLFWYSYVADLGRKFASLQVLAKHLFKVILKNLFKVIAV